MVNAVREVAGLCLCSDSNLPYPPPPPWFPIGRLCGFECFSHVDGHIEETLGDGEDLSWKRFVELPALALSRLAISLWKSNLNFPGENPCSGR